MVLPRAMVLGTAMPLMRAEARGARRAVRRVEGCMLGCWCDGKFAEMVRRWGFWIFGGEGWDCGGLVVVDWVVEDLAGWCQLRRISDI